MNSLRIIGGKFRGKKINFPDVSDLRPTPDRVRETVFNWLAPHIRESQCLDLFAGSGALGLEALSRGAQFVQFVDSSAKVTQYLTQIIAQLDVNASILKADGHHPVAKPAKPYTILFLDPPYHSDLLLASLQWLVTPGFIADKAWIYIETKEPLDLQTLPCDWTLIHSKKAGIVHYHLLRKS